MTLERLKQAEQRLQEFKEQNRPDRRSTPRPSNTLNQAERPGGRARARPDRARRRSTPSSRRSTPPARAAPTG
ncbi:MAG: hypothetical protein MZV70_06265 [Desulfobacterales bacterium]|nr:hypothetical protein [Desulfobacterales bacterium]